jgi:disulfide bond formation protein DsbB
MVAEALAILFVLGSAAILLTALAFEHLGGYLPCPLCMQQRIAYYVAIAAGLIGLGMLRTGRRGFGGTLLAVAGIGFLLNAGLAAYHAGVEWHWWAGPSDCAGGSGDIATGGLLDSLSGTKVVRCDEAQWRFLGLSFAGWNVPISLALAGLGLTAAWRAPRHRR